MRVLGRFVAAAGVGICVLLLGVFAATILGVFALPGGYTDGGGAPGDGFLVLEFVAIGVVISIPVSIAAACWVLFRSERFLKQLLANRAGFFLGR